MTSALKEKKSRELRSAKEGELFNTMDKGFSEEDWNKM